MKDLRIQQLELQTAMGGQNSELRAGGAKPFYPLNQYGTWQYSQTSIRDQNVRGCYWGGGAHLRENCEDLGRAIERGDVQ